MASGQLVGLHIPLGRPTRDLVITFRRIDFERLKLIILQFSATINRVKLRKIVAFEKTSSPQEM